jgi:hypothetical protein
MSILLLSLPLLLLLLLLFEEGTFVIPLSRVKEEEADEEGKEGRVKFEEDEVMGSAMKS